MISTDRANGNTIYLTGKPLKFIQIDLSTKREGCVPPVSVVPVGVGCRESGGG